MLFENPRKLVMTLIWAMMLAIALAIPLSSSVMTYAQGADITGSGHWTRDGTTLYTNVSGDDVDVNGTITGDYLVGDGTGITGLNFGSQGDPWWNESDSQGFTWEMASGWNTSGSSYWNRDGTTLYPSTDMDNVQMNGTLTLAHSKTEFTNDGHEWDFNSGLNGLYFNGDDMYFNYTKIVTNGTYWKLNTLGGSNIMKVFPNNGTVQYFGGLYTHSTVTHGSQVRFEDTGGERLMTVFENRGGLEYDVEVGGESEIAEKWKDFLIYGNLTVTGEIHHINGTQSAGTGEGSHYKDGDPIIMGDSEDVDFYANDDELYINASDIYIDADVKIIDRDTDFPRIFFKDEDSFIGFTPLNIFELDSDYDIEIDAQADMGIYCDNTLTLRGNDRIDIDSSNGDIVIDTQVDNIEINSNGDDIVFNPYQNGNEFQIKGNSVADLFTVNMSNDELLQKNVNVTGGLETDYLYVGEDVKTNGSMVLNRGTLNIDRLNNSGETGSPVLGIDADLGGSVAQTMRFTATNHYNNPLAALVIDATLNDQSDRGGNMYGMRYNLNDAAPYQWRDTMNVNGVMVDHAMSQATGGDRKHHNFYSLGGGALWLSSIGTVSEHDMEVIGFRHAQDSWSLINFSGKLDCNLTSYAFYTGSPIISKNGVNHGSIKFCGLHIQNQNTTNVDRGVAIETEGGEHLLGDDVLVDGIVQRKGFICLIETITQNINASRCYINWDSATRHDTEFFTWTAGDDDITIVEEGWYRINYDGTGTCTGTARYTVEWGLEKDGAVGSWVSMTGSRAFTYHRTTGDGSDTGSCNLIDYLDAGEKIRVYADSDHATAVDTESNACRLTIERI